MPDLVIYFGLPEFVALVGAGLAGMAAVIWVWGQKARIDEQRRLLAGLPYPAMIFDKKRFVLGNAVADEWRNNLDVQSILADSLKSGQNTVRLIPAVEGQSFQARSIRLSSSSTLVILEDIAAAQRQQAFYRNFIQNVSHELKTPLTIIQGHASKMGDAPDDRQGWLASRRIISDEAKRLTQLVDNLLILARLESSALHLDRTLLNFSALIEESILQFSDLAEERQLALSLDISPGCPRLQADRLRLKQAVFNLLDNAIKYTPPGGSITVGVRAEAGRLICAVGDTGEGIPSDDLPYVFDKLYRARRTRSRPVEGSGLGLTIVQQIVRAHGGEVTVESELGHGSTFTLTLPLE